MVVAPAQQDNDEIERPSVETLNSTSVQIQTLVNSGERVLLQTALVPVQSSDRKRTILVKVLLDSASHRSFITERLAKQLHLTSQSKESLSVSTFAARKPYDVSTYVVEFNVITKDKSCMHFYANVIEQITGPIQRGPLQPADRDFLMSISADRLADSIPPSGSLESNSVDLLIGSDYFWSVVGTEKIVLPSGLFLISSKIGYILTGSYLDPTSSQKEVSVSSCLVMTQVNCVVPAMNLLSSADDSVIGNPNIEDLWNLEAIGIAEPLDITNDDRALEQFNRSVCVQNGRYYITWPWKSEHPDLLENFEVALSRLKSLARRFEKDPDLLRKYNEVIQGQVKQGVIERVVDTKEGTLKHYLPHHPVLTPAKNTTKLRVVYDASVKFKKGVKSLNECLYRGPVLLPDLCGILLRLRLYPIVVLSDIEKAFLQVGIQEPDRDVTRFLWFKDVNNVSVSEYNMYRFCRVPFGMVCSPFLLAATIKFHLKQLGTPVAKFISENIYVDNVMLGATSVKQAYEIYVESKEIFQKACMNLREWTSNSSEFLNLLATAEKSEGCVTKAFGIVWNCTDDILQVQGINVCDEDRTPTKRQVLKVIAKIF